MTTYINSQTALETILTDLYDIDNLLIKYSLDKWEITHSTNVGFENGIVIVSEGFNVNYDYENSKYASMMENYTLYIRTSEEDIVTEAVKIINLLLTKNTYYQTNVNNARTIYPVHGESVDYHEGYKWFSISLEIN